jgi:hypothetical protein
MGNELLNKGTEMSIALTYAHVEELLGSALGGKLPKETIRSRIRYLQRLKFPPGISTGKGSRARYGAREVMRILVAMLINLSGETAEQSATIVVRSNSQLAAALAQALDQSRSESIYLAFDVEAEGSLEPVTLKELAKRSDDPARLVLINLSELLDRMDRWFISTALERTRLVRWIERSGEFRQDLRGWSEAEKHNVD